MYLDNDDYTIKSFKALFIFFKGQFIIHIALSLVLHNGNLFFCFTTVLKLIIHNTYGVN